MNILGMWANLILVILLITLFFTTLEAKRFSRRISNNSKRSMSDADPCLDIKHIEDPEEIKFPKRFENIKRPWISEDGRRVKVYTGEGITYQWAWMKSLIVKGLRKSIEDILQFFYKNNCMFIPVGSMVRDLILRAQPVWLSGEVSCNLSDLYTACIKKLGKASCSLYPIEDGGWGEYRLEIGDSNVNNTIDEVRAEPISVYGWRSILGKPRDKWSYTIDMMAIYDDGAGSTYLIDTAEHGYDDTCDKKLVPTVDENNLEVWSDNQLIKVMSFYDLRVNGFSVANSQFQTFINEKIKLVGKKEAQLFYCEHVLKGVLSAGETSVCYTLYPEKESSRRIEQMRNIMIKEMGMSWNETIGKASDDLEAVFCTSKQYSEVRNRIKHRINADGNEVKYTPPKQIVEGEAMISDMAEIHKRPIMTMSEDPVKLPAEFPSMPNAKPNEHLEFVEENVPEVGGYNDPLVYEDSKENSGDINRVNDLATSSPESPKVLKAEDISDAEIEDATRASLAENSDDIVDVQSLESVQLKDYEGVEFNSSSLVIRAVFSVLFTAFYCLYI